MQKLPIVSGEKLVKLLLNLGYEIVRQRGSHARVRKQTEVDEHNITVSMHSEIAKGTLNDILSKVSIWNNIPKGKLIEMVKKI